MQTHTLFEINEYIRRVLALNFAEALWIHAEISQLNISGGHVFMDLVQKGENDDDIIARSEAVIWERAFRKMMKKTRLPLDSILVEGNEIQFKAEVDFHERYGLKLNIIDLDANFTLGRILIKRNETIHQLKSKGLLEKNSSLRLPKVIQKVGVISSANAAGLQDYLHQLRDNPFGYRISNTLLPTHVQGNKAAQLIRSQLKKVRHGLFDCVIIIRGGGAKTDLSAFDDFELGKAIANCPIPVITGIGHDIDETVADQVSHTDMKTPTAVADFILHHNAIFESHIRETGYKIKELAMFSIKKAVLEHHHLTESLIFSIKKKIHDKTVKLDNEKESIQYLIRNLFLRKQKDLEYQQQLLGSYDFGKILKRGFALVTKNGNRIHSIEQLDISDDLNIMLNDGNIDVIVKNKND